MNTTRETSADVREPIQDAAKLEEHLAELESILRRGIELVRNEKYDEFMELGASLDEKLQAVTHTEAPITHISFETIGRVKKLHYELGLILAGQREDMTKRMAQIKTGKSVHKAYKNALG
jgi:hypothetical protein